MELPGQKGELKSLLVELYLFVTTIWVALIPPLCSSCKVKLRQRHLPLDWSIYDRKEAAHSIGWRL